MNPESLKKNLVAILFLVVLLGVLGFSVWKLQAAVATQKAVADELASEQQRLGELQRFKPYPSNENVEIIRQNREIMQELYTHLHDAALRPIQLPKVDRVQFSILLGQKLSELFADARRAKVALPDKFAFSFDQYLVTLPPENRTVISTLTKHLLIIDKLSRMLFQASRASSNGVFSLDGVTREPVTETATDAGGPGPEQLPDGTLFRRLPFEYKFSCNSVALEHFLNDLAKADWFFVVRSLDVTVKSTAVTVPMYSTPAAAAPSMGAPSPMPPGGIMPPGALPGGFATALPGEAQPTTRQVERHTLQVTIKIDLIEFPKPPEAKSASHTP